MPPCSPCSLLFPSLSRDSGCAMQTGLVTSRERACVPSSPLSTGHSHAGQGQCCRLVLRSSQWLQVSCKLHACVVLVLGVGFVCTSCCVHLCCFGFGVCWLSTDKLSAGCRLTITPFCLLQPLSCACVLICQQHQPQIYPENATQAEMMVAAAMKVGCCAVLIV